MGSIRTYLLSKEFLILNGLLAIVFITIAYNLSFRPTDEKPLFQHPTLFFTLFVIIRFFKQFTATKKRIVMLLLAILPLVLQVTVMKLKYDKFQISTISERTMNNYLLAQGVREIQGISDVNRSQEIVQKMKPAEKRSYLMNHRDVYVKLYLNNIADNVTGYKSSVIAPPGYDITKQQNFMSRYNETLFSVSRYFLLLFILISVVDFFRKRMFLNWQQLTIGLLLYYIVFASGISFWQGDRLVVFAIPLWITLYCLLLIRCINSNFVTVLFQQLKGLSK